MTIPFGRCHRNAYGSCDYQWLGFSWEDCPGGWVTKPRLDILLSTKETLLSTNPGPVTHVDYIEFGDPSALLLCF